MTLRSLLPYDKFKLFTRLTVFEVQERLAKNIEPKKVFVFSSFSTRSKPYEGEIVGASFKINRIIGYRNSFLPVIRGEISTGMEKTEISIIMRPTLGTIVFMSFWLGIIGIVCLVIITVAVRHAGEAFHQRFSPGGLIPFFLFAFGYGLMTIGYRVEARKSKNFLRTLWEAEENKQ